MNVLAKARYEIVVNGIGRVLLGFERWRNERKLAGAKGDGLFSPPPQCSAWLKQLIASHYLAGRYAEGARPVAWVTSGAPVEFLVALGYYVLYPENHGAVCGIRRTAKSLCQRAEEEGFSQDICSYARTDFGTMLEGRTPVGRLPRPDLLLCCTNICQTVLYWYTVLADHFGAKLVVIDTPFLYGEATEHQLRFVQKQIEQAIVEAERIAGKSLAPSRLEEVARLSQRAVELWARVLETAQHRPAPFTAFDAFIHMAPIVEMRGHGYTVRYYETLLEQLERRANDGIAAVRNERIRLVWDNLPIWFRMRRLSRFLAERGAALVASTYTNAWGELAGLMDPERPLESAARVYLHPILNRSTAQKLDVMEKLARDWSADGVLLHSDRSCKPYSIGQLDQQRLLRDRLGIPALVLDADHNDPRSYSDAQAESRLQAFLEMLGS